VDRCPKVLHTVVFTLLYVSLPGVAIIFPDFCQAIGFIRRKF
jgi:hypothetical protein